MSIFVCVCACFVAALLAVLPPASKHLLLHSPLTRSPTFPPALPTQICYYIFCIRPLLRRPIRDEMKVIFVAFPSVQHRPALLNAQIQFQIHLRYQNTVWPPSLVQSIIMRTPLGPAQKHNTESTSNWKEMRPHCGMHLRQTTTNALSYA